MKVNQCLNINTSVCLCMCVCTRSSFPVYRAAAYLTLHHVALYLPLFMSSVHPLFCFYQGPLNNDDENKCTLKLRRVSWREALIADLFDFLFHNRSNYF